MHARTDDDTLVLASDCPANSPQRAQQTIYLEISMAAALGALEANWTFPQHPHNYL